MFVHIELNTGNKDEKELHFSSKHGSIWFCTFFPVSFRTFFFVLLMFVFSNSFEFFFDKNWYLWKIIL